MKWFTIVVVSLLISLPAVADVSTHGLSEKQAAELAAMAAQMKVDNTSNTLKSGTEAVEAIMENPELVDKYSQMGTAIAKSIGAAASELGIAVNEFATSSVGKWVMFLTIYHFFGAELVAFIMGFFFVIPLILWAAFKLTHMVRVKEYVTDEKGKRTAILKDKLGEEETVLLGIVYVVTTIMLWISVANFLPG